MLQGPGPRPPAQAVPVTEETGRRPVPPDLVAEDTIDALVTQAGEVETLETLCGPDGSHTVGHVVEEVREPVWEVGRPEPEGQVVGCHSRVLTRSGKWTRRNFTDKPGKEKKNLSLKIT